MVNGFFIPTYGKDELSELGFGEHQHGDVRHQHQTVKPFDFSRPPPIVRDRSLTTGRFVTAEEAEKLREKFAQDQDKKIYFMIVYCL